MVDSAPAVESPIVVSPEELELLLLLELSFVVVVLLDVLDELDVPGSGAVVAGADVDPDVVESLPVVLVSSGATNPVVGASVSMKNGLSSIQPGSRARPTVSNRRLIRIAPADPRWSARESA